MSDISAVKALVFDVFGTSGSIAPPADHDFCSTWSKTRGLEADWTRCVDGAVGLAASMDEVSKPPGEPAMSSRTC